MLIANPIFDSVFKYMMTNLDVAKGVLSAILDEEIVSLDFKPQEHVLKKDRPSGKDLIYYHLDFIAKIKLKSGGYKNALIELQKSNFPYDIQRFRKYLGDQYKREDEIPTENHQTTKDSLPLVTIYFLGFDLSPTLPKVIKVSRQYIDVLNGQEIHERSEFIEKLTHDSYIIQISHLRVELKTKLEEVLSVFQQENFIDKKGHMKSYNHKTKNPLVKKMLHELEKAAADEDIIEQLELEEMALHEYESSMAQFERMAAKTIKQLEEQKQLIEQNKQVIAQKEQVIERNKQVIAQKEQVIELNKQLMEQNKQIIEQKEQVIEQKEQVIEENKRIIKEKERKLEETARELEEKENLIKKLLAEKESK